MADPTTKTNEKPPLIKYGAIAIIALMLLSGAAVYFASSSQNSTGNGNDTNSSSNVGPSRTLIANEVEATVKQLFPTSIIISQTKETDKSKLDEAIGKIPGVRSVNSQFTKLDFNSGSVSYLGEISLTSDVNKETFVDKIFETGLFTSPEVYFQALIETPLEVQAQSEDGKSEKVLLPSNQILGYVNLSTQEKDVVSGPLQILLQGKQVQNAFLFETQNVTQSPKPLALSISAPVLELQPKLIITGKLDYVPNFSEASLQTSLKLLPQISGVDNVLFPRKDNLLLIELPQASLVSNDINSFVVAHAAQYVSFNWDSNSLYVGLGNISLAQAKTQLSQVVESALSTNTELKFTDPQIQLLVDINTSSPNTTQAAQSILNYFTSLDANASVQMYQPGTLSISSLVDGNSSYPIVNSKLKAYLQPGHTIGSNVSVQVSGTVVRNQLVEVTGIETSPTP